MQQIIDKTNREKGIISDFQSKLTRDSIDNTRLISSLPGENMLSIQDLNEKEQLIVNENKLLEVNLICNLFSNIKK